MNIMIILAHPREGSFNHAIAETARYTLKNRGYEVVFHDLYQEKFDAILPYAEITRDAEIDPIIKKHCDELVKAHGIIIIHPNWWGQPPAILKGWIDRVIRAGVAYKFVEGDKGEGVPLGLLKTTCALVLNTSDTPQQREQEVFGDPLETIWKNCIFGLCGVKTFHRKNYGVIVTSTLTERKKWLEDVKKTIELLF
ncbi:MAG: NAD(P)H-dependent oxidoreductase [Methanobacterium sp.]|nr:NAD(P)H-dependent oxidoreductase [Methanobacterium sp.]